MLDTMVRQLEYFIRNNGTLKELKQMLSTCMDDKEFLKKLKAKNIQ